MFFTSTSCRVFQPAALSGIRPAAGAVIPPPPRLQLRASELEVLPYSYMFDGLDSDMTLFQGYIQSLTLIQNYQNT